MKKDKNRINIYWPWLAAGGLTLFAIYQYSRYTQAIARNFPPQLSARPKGNTSFYMDFLTPLLSVIPYLLVALAALAIILGVRLLATRKSPVIALSLILIPIYVPLFIIIGSRAVPNYEPYNGPTVIRDQREIFEKYDETPGH